MRTFKTFATLMLLLMSTDVIAQSNTPQPSSRQEGIPMSVVSAKRPCNRMPAQPIYVYQDGRTLMFDEEHAGDTVTVMDGDNVIFTATIGSIIPQEFFYQFNGWQCLSWHFLFQFFTNILHL